MAELSYFCINIDRMQTSRSERINREGKIIGREKIQFRD